MENIMYERTLKHIRWLMGISKRISHFKENGRHQTLQRIPQIQGNVKKQRKTRQHSAEGVNFMEKLESVVNFYQTFCMFIFSYFNMQYLRYHSDGNKDKTSAEEQFS